jgi:hypothetical protein
MQYTSVSRTSIAPPAHLFDVFRDIGHGRAEHLSVTRGTPQITAKTKLFQRFREGRPEPPAKPPLDYSGRRPHPQHLKFLEHCRLVQDGDIERVEVADGLPMFWSPHGQPHE